MGEQIWLARAAQGPVRRLALNLTQTYVIWKFAENIDGAKKFLVDYSEQFRQGSGEFLVQLAMFSQTVPDLESLCAHDAQATPPDKYKILADALTWTTHLGYPGYTNAAIDEILTPGSCPACSPRLPRASYRQKKPCTRPTCRCSASFSSGANAAKCSTGFVPVC